MFQGYNLKLGTGEVEYSARFYELGKQVHADHKAQMDNALAPFASANGSLLASKMQQSWFPRVFADVFISHSHSDETTAVCLAGWMKEQFNLVAFVDSCVWGYSERLLALIDKAYCYDPETSTYNYDKRNGSTSHVHMMLSVALSEMIDASECVMFLNTPSSMRVSDVIGSYGKSATLSPWIYSELAATRLIRRREHRPGVLKKLAKDHLGEAERLIVEYNPPTDHLSDLSVKDLLEWETVRRKRAPRSDHSLDLLYRLKRTT